MGIRINMENRIDAMELELSRAKSQIRGMVSIIDDLTETIDGLKTTISEMNNTSTKKVAKNETKKSNKKAIRTSDDSIDKGHTDSKSKTE